MTCNTIFSLSAPLIPRTHALSIMVALLMVSLDRRAAPHQKSNSQPTAQAII